jgi:hypothetical protein
MASKELIEDQDDSVLDDLEKELVRQIVGITGRPGTATYVESNARMSELLPVQTQIVRALILDYDEIGLSTLSVIGGSRGANFDVQRDREAIATELRRMLYPTEANENPNISTYSPLGTIHMIPIEYSTGPEGERD